MLKFQNQYQKKLPYDPESYCDYINDDFPVDSAWSGVTFYWPSKENNQWSKEDNEINIAEDIVALERLALNVISKLDDGAPWIVDAEYGLFKWFYDRKNLNRVKKLRTFFRQNKIDIQFKGSLLLNKEDLSEVMSDIIAYPFVLRYRNLDISHPTNPFVIKTTHHLTIELLSTDKELLTQVVLDNLDCGLKIAQQRGTTLNLPGIPGQ
jgi:hypothetical protein